MCIIGVWYKHEQCVCACVCVCGMVANVCVCGRLIYIERERERKRERERAFVEFRHDAHNNTPWLSAWLWQPQKSDSALGSDWCTIRFFAKGLDLFSLSVFLPNLLLSLRFSDLTIMPHQSITWFCFSFSFLLYTSLSLSLPLALCMCVYVCMHDYNSLKVEVCVAITTMSCDQTALKCTTKKTNKKHCVLRVYLIIQSQEYKDVYMGIEREKKALQNIKLFGMLKKHNSCMYTYISQTVATCVLK